MVKGSAVSVIYSRELNENPLFGWMQGSLPGLSFAVKVTSPTHSGYSFVGLGLPFPRLGLPNGITFSRIAHGYRLFTSSRIPVPITTFFHCGATYTYPPRYALRKSPSKMGFSIGNSVLNLRSPTRSLKFARQSAPVVSFAPISKRCDIACARMNTSRRR